MSDDDTIPQAAEIEIGLCDCPAIHLVMLADNGDHIARIALDADSAESLSRDLAVCAREFRAITGDTIGLPEGLA